MELRLIIILVLCISFSQIASARAEQYHFANSDDRQRFYQLSKELRCDVCQNQSIAESTSHHAIDMRAQIYKMIGSGEPDQAIKDYLAYRYGDHILFCPTWHAGTWLLWLAPICMVLASGWFILRLYRCVST